jgi:hypothetical protein
MTIALVGGFQHHPMALQSLDRCRLQVWSRALVAGLPGAQVDDSLGILQGLER